VNHELGRFLSHCLRNWFYLLPLLILTISEHATLVPFSIHVFKENVKRVFVCGISKSVFIDPLILMMRLYIYIYIYIYIYNYNEIDAGV
jgi:hypothetical protein